MENFDMDPITDKDLLAFDQHAQDEDAQYDLLAEQQQAYSDLISDSLMWR